MRKMWNDPDAPAGVRTQITDILSRPVRCTTVTVVNGEMVRADGDLSRAESWLRAAELAWRYNLLIEAPPSTATDRVNAYRAKIAAGKRPNATPQERADGLGAAMTLNEAYQDGLNFEADREARCLARFNGIMSKYARDTTEQPEPKAPPQQRKGDAFTRAAAEAAGFVRCNQCGHIFCEHSGVHARRKEAAK